MRVAVTGSTGRLGSALVRALEEAPFTGPSGRSGESRPDLDLDTITPASVGRSWIATAGRRGPLRRVDGCRRLCARPRPGRAPKRRGARVLARTAELGASTSCSSRPTRCSTGGGPTAAGMPHKTSATRSTPARARPRVRCSPGRRTPTRSRPDWRTRDRARRLAPWAARQRLPGQDRRALRARGGGRAAAGRGRRSARRPTHRTSPMRSSAPRGGRPRGGWRSPRDPPPVNGGRASRADWAREVLRARDRGRGRGGPGKHLATGRTPPCGRSSSRRRSVREPMRDWRAAFADARPPPEPARRT
jgi:hypothetical protein